MAGRVMREPPELLRNVLELDLKRGCTAICVCENLSNCIFRICALFCTKLYLKKKKKKRKEKSTKSWLHRPACLFLYL